LASDFEHDSEPKPYQSKAHAAGVTALRAGATVAGRSEAGMASRRGHLRRRVMPRAAGRPRM